MAAIRLAVLCLCVCVLAAPAAAGVYPRDKIMAALKAERTGNGIPPVTENPQWSDDCRLHNLYEETNATFGHEEDPGKPGYTAGGAWAGLRSVLAGDTWAKGDPFLQAPLHLAALMNPRLAQTGVDEYDGLVCMVTSGGAVNSFAAPRIFSFPGDGATNVMPSEVAGEWPFTPEDVIGISDITGFNIMAWAVGLPDPTTAHVVSASLLDSSSRPVPLAVVDDKQPTIGDYMDWGSAFLIPIDPLRDRARYTASVTFVDGTGATVSRSWSFTTGRAFDFVDPMQVFVEASLRGMRLTIRTDGPQHVRIRSDRVVNRYGKTRKWCSRGLTLSEPKTIVQLRPLCKLRRGSYWVEARTVEKDSGFFIALIRIR